MVRVALIVLPVFDRRHCRLNPPLEVAPSSPIRHVERGANISNWEEQAWDLGVAVASFSASGAKIPASLAAIPPKRDAHAHISISLLPQSLDLVKLID